MIAGMFTVCASAAEYALVGSYTSPSWNFDASRNSNGVLVEKDGKYETEIATLTSGFKIVDIENNNWDVQFGAPSGNDLVVVGQTFTLKAKNGGADPGNLDFANYVTSVNNAKVVFDPVELTLTITGDAVSDLKLFISGSMVNWAEPGKDGSIAMTEEGGVYSATVDFNGTAASPAEFKIFGAGWSPEFGLASDNEPVMDAENLTKTLARSNKNIKVALTGEYLVSFELATLKVTLTSKTGVAGIVADDNVAPVYYNLLGVKVENPSQGIYLVKHGKKVSKEIVK